MNPELADPGWPVTRRARALIVKILSLGLLALLALALPPLLTVSNVREGVVLGRYTASYFAFVVVYLAAVVIWMVITAWLVSWLDVTRLATLQARIARHIRLLNATLLAALAAVIGMRVAVLAGLVPHFPGVLDAEMRFIPAVSVTGLLAIAGLLLGPVPRTQLDALLRPAVIGKWPWRLHPGVIIGLALPITLMLVLALVFGLWQMPLRNDPSVHIYLGQSVLAGAMPYRDVVYFHPPLRFAVSVLWSLLSRLTGMSVVDSARLLDALAAAGCLIAVYVIGRAYSGRSLGGVLAALLLAGTEYLSDVLLAGPTFRLMTALLMLLSVAAAQRKAWGWAGVLAALSGLLWAPAGVIWLALIIYALLSARDRRVLLTLLVSAGGVLLAASALLLGLGVLGDALAQVAALGQVLQTRYLTPGSGAVTRAAGEKVAWFLWSLRGDWEIVAVMALGVLAAPFDGGLRALLRDPRRAVPVLAVLVMLPVFVLEYYGSSRDALMLIVLLPPFGATLLTHAVARLAGNAIELRWPALGYATGALMAALVFALGAADSVTHHREAAASVHIPLAEQARMAQELDTVLGSEEHVQAVGNLWFADLSGRLNATPFVQWVRLGESALISEGWTPEAMVAELERQAPAMVMTAQGSGPGVVSDWLGENYTAAGRLAFDDGPQQMIYVRQGREDLAAVVGSWPQAADDAVEGASP